MIEAVNSVLANASLVRTGSGQDDVVRAEVQRAQNDVPKAPYISPYISLDNNYNAAVIQIRDSETGDVLTQFPSESRLRAKQQEQVVLQAPPQPQQQVQSVDTSSQQVASAGFVAQSISSDIGVPAASSGGIAQAQIASAALASGAQSGQLPSGEVNVTA